MNNRTVLVLSLSLAFAGCGKQEPAPTAPETAPAGGSTSMPSLATEAPPPPPPGPTSAGQAPAGGPSAVTVAPAAIDFASGDRPNDASGKPLSDLAWLNRIVEGYLMRNALPDTALPQGKFNSPQEESAAYTAAMEKKQKGAGLRDLSDLVKAGLIKRIPEAPPGKKYVFDHKSGSVVMVNQ